MPKNSASKLVIDTNLWISFIISKKLIPIENVLINHSSRVLFSAELLEELQETVTKPKLQKYFGENALEEMMSVFDPFIDFINVKSKVQLCRDPKDDFLLALAKDGKADFLLIGDKDLLDIGKFGQTQILKITEFLAKVK